MILTSSDSHVPGLVEPPFLNPFGLRKTATFQREFKERNTTRQTHHNIYNGTHITLSLSSLFVWISVFCCVLWFSLLSTFYIVCVFIPPFCTSPSISVFQIYCNKFLQYFFSLPLSFAPSLSPSLYPSFYRVT